VIETTLRIVIYGLLTGGIYALIAMGLSLQYGVARVLNIAHGEFIMLGAMITCALYTSFGINPLLSLAISGPLLFAIAFLIHRTLFKSLRTRAPSPAAFEGNSLLAAFGLLFVIQSIATLIWTANTRTYTYLNIGVEFAGTVYTVNRLVALAVSVFAALVFYFFVTRSRLGKAIRAAAQDPATAGLMGININTVLALCFGLGAFLAGLAGLLTSMYNALSTTMGLNYTVIALIVIVLGGLGSIPGSLIGGFILGIIGSIIIIRADPSLSVVVYYGIFLLLLLVRPVGIFGKR
jgi:branched-chain amino acid transport system permease protein